MLRNSNIYSAITRISGDIASTPIESNNISINNKLDYQLINTIMIQVLEYGNCFVLPIYENNNFQDFEILKNDNITLDIQNGEVVYKYQNNNENYVFNANEILHFRLNPKDNNGLIGTSPLNSLKDVLKIQKKANNIIDRFYSEGLHGSILLKANTDLNEEQKNKIRNEFTKSMNDNLGSIITDNSIDVSTISNSVNSDILKIAQSNDWLSKQVAQAFSVPNYILGVEDEHSNQNQVENIYNQTLKNIYQPIIISELNKKLQGTFNFEEPCNLSANDVSTLVQNNVINADMAIKILHIKQK